MMYIRNLVGLHLKYYTDQHAVDEETRTIANQGGEWNYNVMNGVCRRCINNNPFTTLGHVASKYNNKNSTLITGVEFYMICSNLWICQITEE